ncbi:MAG: glycyl-radical enzyme activating protein [Candidatus Aminicenantes bacterium]|nr:MAG: glycyl-radical enzyme activating protein [Candidatus Aminicenantes bacterium]
MQGIIFDIKRFAIHDGPGIRTTVFLKGCPMKCPWCHNPEGQKKCPERGWNNGKKEIIGEKRSVDEVMREIDKEVVFYDESKGGVTFSGGEPLVQPKFLQALLQECRKRDIHTTLDTTGYVSPRIFKSIIDKVDLFLYDLKIMDEQTHIRYTGVSNRPVIENLRILSKKGKKVIIRFPVIPGITDTKENIKKLGTFVASLKNIDEIDLLPYHRTAEGKYRHLKKENKMKEMAVMPPTDEQMNKIQRLFEKYTAPHIKIKRE